MNLYDETINKLSMHEKTLDDVLWVGTLKCRVPNNDIKKLLDVEYDFSSGEAMINPWLLVVGRGWWLERCLYDGTEWWDYKEYPEMPHAIGTPSVFDYEDDVPHIDYNDETTRELRYKTILGEKHWFFVCAYCHQELDVNQTVCDYCGKRIKWSE